MIEIQNEINENFQKIKEFNVKLESLYQKNNTTALKNQQIEAKI